ncbi:hypothetical protein PAP18089_01016 [Pandoraea apista]|uniref:Uncharacterized protein n=1 Tax=Pandoraea apista TaxID=93218 RepID=A0A5E5P0H6_9BURK|nr:hypothetical protein LMG16407_02649 [Pandoraea apista]VVG70058.1 hypothetical protein PAP18089_01016 [Pandoraea apista]
MNSKKPPDGRLFFMTAALTGFVFALADQKNVCTISTTL